MFKKTLGAVLAVFAISSMVTAQDTIPVNFGVAPGLSYRKTDEAVVFFNASLINSRAAVIAGIDLAGLVSSATRAVNGYQAAGLVATTQDLMGFQAAGIYSGVSGNATGYQMGGLVSRINGDLRGIQAGGLLSIIGGTTYGGQTGFINVAKELTGFQAGFINISSQLNGVPFGLINIAGNGNVSAIAYASNFSGANAGAKFIANNFVSTITVGGYDYQQDLDTAISFATSWGYHIPLNPVYIEIDAANMTLIELAGFDADTVHSRTLAALRLTLGIDIGKYLGIFAGAGAGYQVELRDEDVIDDGFKPLYFAGITLF